MDTRTYRKREARLRVKEQEYKRRQEREEKLKTQIGDHKGILKSPLIPKALKKTTDTYKENSNLI